MFNDIYKDSNSNSYDVYCSELIHKFILKVYCWMSFGLFITSLVSFYVSKSSYLLYFLHDNILFFIILSFIQLYIMFVLSNYTKELSENNIITLFIMYSILTGINLSTVFLIYTSYEISYSFLSILITFILMSIYGYFSKSNLIKLNNILLMFLLGIFISSIINIYFSNYLFEWIISYISIFIFIGLIIIDTKKIKNLGSKLIYNEDYLLINKYSILGALILYLDFINLFLIPLKIIKNNNNNNNKKEKK
ncbi:membrane protein [endosymbiont of Euscepes postfasciatus]|uniref:Bax inhibitor-1/YccA family protein n=1 Tax=endosymbiont of Euscepes postfasciatus TaxID=650377 RepID=UPI000DC6EC62|nr:Bax inhibitor-1/YccA family protein [endosymbiont of Euscepes postfasciatus]BBA84594.1 membrane protein [endosymbiont of Euscepes postfasciatus]